MEDQSRPVDEMTADLKVIPADPALTPAGGIRVPSVREYMRQILSTPLPPNGGAAARRVGWEPKARMAPWLKEELPELAGDKLPPLIDYFFHAVTPNSLTVSDLFRPGLSRHGRAMGWIRMIGSFVLMGFIAYIMVANQSLLPFLYVIIIAVSFALKGATHVHHPTVPAEILFTRQPEAVQELALTPITGRDLLAGQIVRTLKRQKFVWVGVFLGIVFALVGFRITMPTARFDPMNVGAYATMMLCVARFLGRYGEGTSALACLMTFFSPLDRLLDRKTWTREERRARRRFAMAGLILSLPVWIVVILTFQQVTLLVVGVSFAVPLFLAEAAVIFLLAHTRLVRLGQRILRARFRRGLTDIDRLYRALRERQLLDIEEGRPVSGLRGQGRFGR